MNRRYDVFDIIMLIGYVLIIVALGITFVVQAADLSEAFVSLGVWVICSFALSVYLHGIMQGVPRTEIKVPKVPALLAFGISAVLFFSAWVLSRT